MPSKAKLSQFNSVAQLAFVVVDIALRGAHVLVPRQRLYHPHINALVRQFGQKLPSAAVAACTFDACEGGLRNDRDGDRRSSYCLRHTYATKRLEKGDVGVYDLSINMGSEVKQIEIHYSHVF